MAQDEVYREAQYRIERAQRQQATRLGLNELRLTALPPEIGQLTCLQSLDLRYNQLTALPPEIGQLTNLQSLYLHGNELIALPPEIGQLTGLQVVYLGENGLTALPPEIGQLTKVQSLYLHGNRLTALPPEIGQLTGLQILHLRGNRLTTLPPEIGQLTDLHTLELTGNPLQPDLASAYKQGTEELFRLLRERAKAEVVLHEAKLILTGEGAVGKSSLLGALRGDPWIEGRDTTHGVEIKPVRLTDAETSTEVTLNAWDFGGQPVYRPTHQLFFSAPAIYLVVWKPRQGPEQGFVRYWTRLIKHRAYDPERPGERPRVLIVATHGGPQERQAHIDRHALKEEFGDLIVDFYHVDSKPDPECGDCAGLDALKQVIARAVIDIYPQGRPVAASWAKVLEALRRRSRRDPYITYRQFEHLCRPQTVNRELAALYARILNELGHLIHYADDEGLQDVVILRAEWLSKAISFVLDDRRAKEQNGLIAHHRFRRLWDNPDKPPEERYPAELHPIFLRLMERFDLTYRVALPGATAEQSETSLVAQLVPGERPPELQSEWPLAPEEHNEQQIQVCRIVDAATGVSAPAEGLIYQLIVRLHRYSVGRNDYRLSRHWQRGLLLDDGYNGRALLEQIGNDVRITVRAAYPYYFMGDLRGEVKWLVEHFWKGLDCRIAVPCGRSGCQGLLDLDTLMQRRVRGYDEDMCPVCQSWVWIDGLLARPPKMPALPAAVAELKQGQAEIQQGLESGFEATRADLLRLISQADEQFAQLMAAYGDPARDGPRLFSLTPVDGKWWHRSRWASQKVRLTLWCEHSRLPLPELWGDPKRGTYEFEWPREWLVRIAPYASLIAGTLSLVLPVAGSALKVGLDQATYDRIEKGLDLAQESFSALLDGAGEEGDEDADRLSGRQQVRLPARGDRVGRHGLLYAAHDGALRELHALLKKKDPSLGGLKRVQNRRREYLWVHPNYSKLYAPDLPVIPPPIDA